MSVLYVVIVIQISLVDRTNDLVVIASVAERKRVPEDCDSAGP